MRANRDLITYIGVTRMSNLVFTSLKASSYRFSQAELTVCIATTVSPLFAVFASCGSSLFPTSWLVMGSSVDLADVTGNVLAFGEIVRYGRPLFNVVEDERFPIPVIIPLCITDDDVSTHQSPDTQYPI